MIEVLGLRLGDGVQRAQLERDLREDWLVCWQKRHPSLARPSLKKETEARAVASLAGLCLAAQAGVDEAIAYSEGGRPHFVGNGLDFSITHTANAVLCAIGEGPLGLDAEGIDGSVDHSDSRFIERWFSKNERLRYAADPTRECFLELWTRKEAAVKASGAGLSALALTDTIAMEEEGACAFLTWREEGLTLSLCHPAGAVVLPHIKWI